MPVLLRLCRQHKAIRKVSLDAWVSESGTPGQIQQLFRRKAAQYRERAILANETIVQKEAADSCVKK